MQMEGQKQGKLKRKGVEYMQDAYEIKSARCIRNQVKLERLGWEANNQYLFRLKMNCRISIKVGWLGSHQIMGATGHAYAYYLNN